MSSKYVLLGLSAANHVSHPLYLAFLSALPFAGIQWALTWTLRYLPVPMKNSLLRLLVQLTLSLVFVGIWITQIKVYMWVAGLASGDNVIVAVLIAENVIGFGLILLAVRARQRRIQGTQAQI
jgi:hypothetical protein